MYCPHTGHCDAVLRQGLRPMAGRRCRQWVRWTLLRLSSARSWPTAVVAKDPPRPGPQKTLLASYDGEACGTAALSFLEWSWQRFGPCEDRARLAQDKARVTAVAKDVAKTTGSRATDTAGRSSFSSLSSERFTQAFWSVLTPSQDIAEAVKAFHEAGTSFTLSQDIAEAVKAFHEMGTACTSPSFPRPV